jgi:hypothetical protein
MHKSKWCILTLIILTLVLTTQEFPLVRAQSRLLYGTVFSASTGQPLSATVTVSGCSYAQSASTGSDGSWQIAFPYGTFGRITFSAPGYVSETFQVGINGQWFDAGGIVSLQPST